MLYRLVLLLGGMLLLPKALFSYVRGGKGRESLPWRLGFKTFEFSARGRPVAWIHAVSVGETQAVFPLAKKLELAGFDLVISNVTETGHALSKQLFPKALLCCYLPIDLPSLVTRCINQVSPKLVIVSESDLWYSFLKSAKAHGAEVFVVNGKISSRSSKLFSLIKPFAKRLFSLPDKIFAQSLEYKARYCSLGVPEEKIIVTGNMKFEPRSKTGSRVDFKIPKDKAVIFGSTHEGEERLFLEVLKELDGVKGVIVPRHPERFDRVWNEILKSGQRASRFSLGIDPDAKILLIDKMGYLEEAYNQGTVAVVGGSFISGVGGHNILEPIFAKIPVLFGPYMEGQKEMVNEVLWGDVGVQVSSKALLPELKKFLNDKVLYQEYQERIARFFDERSSISAAVLSEILREKACGKMNVLDKVIAS